MNGSSPTPSTSPLKRWSLVPTLMGATSPGWQSGAAEAAPGPTRPYLHGRLGQRSVLPAVLVPRLLLILGLRVVIAAAQLLLLLGDPVAVQPLQKCHHRLWLGQLRYLKVFLVMGRVLADKPLFLHWERSFFIFILILTPY